MIRLTALGPATLTGADPEGVQAVLAQPKRLALLVYLAVATPRGFRRRDELLGLFWPEADQEHARGALGTAVHFLRRALGQEVVVSRGGHDVGLSPGAVWCDAAVFEETLDAGRVDEALALYTGDLMPGFFLDDAPEFEQWLEKERARLRRRALDAARARADEHQAAGNPAPAIQVLRRAMELSPTDENLVRRLMAALDAAGDRAGALETYEAAVRQLDRELQVEPSPETVGLRDAIRSRRRALRLVDYPPTHSAPSPTPGAQGVGSRPAAPTRARTRYGLLGAAAAILLVAVVALTRGGGGPTGSADRLAVIPFAPATADSALERLGRDLVITLSANLDGLGTLQTVDALTVLAHLPADRRPPARDESRRLAAGWEAGLVLQGALVRVGPLVRAEAAVSRSGDGRVVARAAATAAPEQLAVLTDSITWAVLEQIGQVPPTAPTLGAVTSHSIPALREYLDGERAISENRWRQAPDHFARAIALDSTFWYAYWRYSYARGYRGLPVDSTVRAVVLERRRAFPERDRLLIEVDLADTLSDRLERGRAVTERFPTSWQAWFDYADQLVHAGPFGGSTGTEARAALELAIALNPSSPAAWQHLFWIAVAEPDTVTTAAALRRLAALGHDSATTQDSRLDELQYFRYADLLARRNGEPDPASADALVAQLVGYGGPVTAEGFAPGLSLYGFHRAQADLSLRASRNRAIPAPIRAAFSRSLMMAWAGRGAWDSALAAGARYVRDHAGSEHLLHAYRLAAVGEWLGALPAGASTAWRAALQLELPSPPVRAELAWLDGIRAAGRGDLGALFLARREVAGTDSIDAMQLDRSLGAFAAYLRGDVAGAAAAMAELERQRTEHSWFRRRSSRYPYLTAVNRLAAGRWLAASGDTARAARLLTWHEAVQFPSHLSAHADATLGALIYAERARLAGSLGQTERARQFYQQFLRRYDLPVAAQMHLVVEARAALASGAAR